MVIKGATANTKLGNAVRNKQGLEPIFGYDFWLLQEVHRERDGLDRLLAEETDLKVAVAADDMGLAIVVRNNIEVLSESRHIIREAGKLTLLAKGLLMPGSLKFRQRARGVLATTILVDNDRTVTLATAHPPIPHDRSHTGHVQEIAPILNGIAGPLVFGGDMNHWPNRKACDLKMAEDANLNWVDIGDIPTWHAAKSRQKPVAAMLGMVGISLDGQLDAMYTRGVDYRNAHVLAIGSDHEAEGADFDLLAA